MRAKQRIQEIAKLVENKNCVADIGTDHGYLTKILIEEGRVQKVIATDISEKSLQKAINLATKFGFENKVDFRVGDGFNPLENNEVDVAIIAGIGGQEIIKILQTQNHKGVKKFIFAPAQNVPELRKYLSENGFEIVYDKILKDQKKFYSTLKVEKCLRNKKLQKSQILFGKWAQNPENQDFFEYLCVFIDKRNQLLKNGIDSEKIKNELKIAIKIKNKIENKENEKCKRCKA